MLKIYVAGILIVVAIVAIYWFGVRESQEVIETEQQEVVGDEAPAPVMKLATMVTSTDDGYSHKEVSITKGNTVIFKNDSSRAVWTASAMHPTHLVYPGTDIKDCNTEKVMFDACVGIEPGEEWEFQFNEVGEWGYHDHLRPSNYGKVIVE